MTTVQAINQNDALVQANLPIPPETVLIGAATTTAQVMDLTAYQELFVTVVNDSTNSLYYLVGGSAVSPLESATSGSQCCSMIPAGGKEQFFLRAGGPTRLGYKTSTGTATMRVHASSAKAIVYE